MSVKDNIEFLKEEISSEEKFLEQIIKIEKFYKKYKKPLIAFIVILIVGTLFYVGYDLKKEHDLKVSNEAYMKLLKNPNDTNSLNILKEKNQRLYYAYIFQNAIKNSDIKKLEEISLKNIYPISNIAKYQVAALKEDIKKLQNYEYDQNSLLKDFAILDESFLLYKENKIKEAHNKLKNIDKNSIAYPYAKFLLHFGIKGKI